MIQKIMTLKLIYGLIQMVISLKYLFSNLAKLDLSKDASELMNIVLLTNSYYPEINITEDEFLKIKSDWLIKNNDRNLIEEYLIKNQIIKSSSRA